jgi:alkyl hydroperoxide reductase subunit AhpC
VPVIDGDHDVAAASLESERAALVTDGTHGIPRHPLIRQVKAFQHVRATGEVTPSGWEPGQVTLKPGPALMGRVWEVWKP